MVRISSSIHTKIDNFLDLRRDVLETELKAVELLQKLKKYRKESESKKEAISQFKKEISSVKDSIEKLEFQDLPMDIEREKRAEEAIARPQKRIREQIEEEMASDELSQDIMELKEKIESLKI